MSAANTKSAISVLEEFCKRKLQPPSVYTFNSDDASDFVCTVNAFNETKTGKAKSKKKAKHAAAQNLINHLRNLESFKFDLVFLNASPDFVDDTKVTSSTSKEKKRRAEKTEPEINYVGKLLEHCVKNKLPPASFDVIEHTTNTQSHLKEFFMKCCVNDVEKRGQGFNKKQAKQQAAMEVLKVLMAGQTDLKDVPKIDEPPPKRLKSIDYPTDSLSEISTNIVPKIDNKETVHENLFNFCSHHSSDSDDEEETSYVPSDYDCEEIDSTELLSIPSESYSDSDDSNYWMDGL